MSYIQSLHHIVIGTHYREMSLNTEHSTELYAYMSGLLRNKGCKVHAINGIPDHIHILVDIPATTCIAELMRVLKRATSIWLKESPYFPLFNGWGKEYAAFSVSYSHKQAVMDYIASQREHHADKRFDDEYQRLIMKNGLVYYNPENR